VAARLASERGLSIEVIDVRSLVPLDMATLVQSVEKTGRLIIVHEAVRTSGFAGEIMARINEEVFYSLEAPMIRLTGYDTPYPVPQVEDDWLPNEGRLLAAIEQVLQD